MSWFNEISQLSKRFLTALVPCLLCLFVLSNRPFVVRQLIGPNSNTRFHSPVGDSTSSHAGRNLFFMELVDDAGPDLQDIQRNGIGIETDSQTAIEEHWIGVAAKTEALFRSPVQRFESVLNL